MNAKPSIKVPVVYGGLIIGLVSSIPFVSLINCFCCAGVLGGGLLAVYFYKSSFTAEMTPMTSSDCVVVGLVAGCCGAVISVLLATMFTALFGNVAGQMVLDMLRNSRLQIPEASLQQLQEAIYQPFAIGRFVLQLFISLLAYGIFGLLGGLIGYSIFKPKGLTPMPPPPGMPTA